MYLSFISCNYFGIFCNNFILFNVGNIVSRIHRKQYHLIAYIKRSIKVFSIRYILKKIYLTTQSFLSVFLSRFISSKHALVHTHTYIHTQMYEFMHTRSLVAFSETFKIANFFFFIAKSTVQTK